MGKRFYLVGSLALAVFASTAPAKDLGDILLKKGLITEEDLKQAREEDKQKAAAEESRRDAIMAKLPKWLDMITPFGDLRNRVEGFYGDNYHAETRYRMRARIGLTATPSDEISGTVRLASGNQDDPISRNQTFTNLFSSKQINLDWAYMTIKPGKTVGLEPGWGQIVLGKFPVLLARESEMIWDDDLAPEGASETLNLWEQREGFLRSVRLNGLQWEMNEVTTNNDGYVVGAQAAVDTAIGSAATWSMSFADYSFQGMNQIARTYFSPFGQTQSASNCPSGVTGTCYGTNSPPNTQLANTNALRFSAPDANNKRTVVGYASGFNLINVGSELDFPNPVGVGIPAGVFADFVNNTQADGRDTGVTVGVGIGKAQRDWYHDSLKNPGDWGASYSWVWVEQDAVSSLFSYSDFYYQQPTNPPKNPETVTTLKGSSNVTGSILRLDYEVFQNFQMTAKFAFINPLDPGVATLTNGQPYHLVGNSTLTRMQLDAVFKF